MSNNIGLSIKIDARGLKSKLKRWTSQVEQLPERALAKFIKNTPIDTGHARRNTVLQPKNIIEGDYPYSRRLENGWSRQAPNGMVTPTEKWLKQEFNRIFKR
jgi:hypothetical protein